MMTGCIDARNSYSQCEHQPGLANGHGAYPLSLVHRIAFVSPIRAEAGGKIEHAHFGESHLLQFLVRGADVRAVIIGAAAAIDHHLLVMGERRGALFQFFDAFRPGCRAHQFSAANMALVIKDDWTYIEDYRLLSAAALYGFGQFVRLDTRQIGVGIRLLAGCQESNCQTREYQREFDFRFHSRTVW